MINQSSNSELLELSSELDISWSVALRCVRREEVGVLALLPKGMRCEEELLVEDCWYTALTDHVGASDGGSSADEIDCSLVLALNPPCFVAAFTRLSIFMTSLFKPGKWKRLIHNTDWVNKWHTALHGVFSLMPMHAKGERTPGICWARCWHKRSCLETYQDLDNARSLAMVCFLNGVHVSKQSITYAYMQIW